ncbi:MAG TPA: DUF2520 domain-containing protein [Syntrophales bacterium]|nr:DUF2520 domain-containing protein [Syntrophales bacterium]
MAETKDRICIIGMGKVGTAVGHLLSCAGYRIVAVASRTAASAEKGASLAAGAVPATPAEAAARADCVLITTSDDAIAAVCRDIAREGCFRKDQKVVHMSGAGGLDLLAPARDAGARVAGIHPIQSFADVPGAIKNIPGSTFGIISDPEIRDWCVGFVRDLGGVPFFVPEAEKPLYHAAACIASNYLVALMNAVEDIYAGFGLSPDEAKNAFWPLVMGTIRNIESKGTIQALTGPIARGDSGTIRKHLRSFAASRPSLLPAYRELGLLAVDVGLRKGTISAAKADEIKKILKGESE